MLPVTEDKQSGFIVNPVDFPEVKMDFLWPPVRLRPTWNSIDKNYPGELAWWRGCQIRHLHPLGPGSRR